MKNLVRGGFGALILATAVWAIGCESTRTPAHPSTVQPSGSLSFTTVPATGANAPLTVAWHCVAASTGWQAADCPPAAGARLNATVSAALTAPGLPAGLTGSVSSARVTLAWTAPSGGDQPTSYIVEAGSASGRADLANFDTGTSAPSLIVDNVPAGTYFVRVRAKNGAGVSGPSNEVAVTVTGVGACLPSAPGNLAASANGSTVTLQWTPPAGACAPTGYVIEAGSAPGAANLANFNTGNAATTFVAPGVGAGTYYVRVRGSNAAGTGAPSNEATLVVSAGGCSAAPAAPGGLNASVNGSTVSLTWGGVAGATSYVLEAGSGPGLSNLLASDQGPATSLSATASAGTYYVRVRAKNACGTGAASNEVVVTVGAAAPGCTYSVSPASQTVSNTGGTATATVTTASGCQWTAVSNSSFITVTSGASGSGNGTVGYSVAANSGATRTGTLTIAGQTVTVTQGTTTACTFTVSPPSPNFDAVGGSTTFTITASAPTCAWTAQSLVGAIAITGATAGTGSGTTTAVMQANAGTQRAGTVLIAGQTIVISQDAPLPPLARNNGCPGGGKSPAPDNALIQFINANTGTITVTPLDANGAELTQQRQTLTPSTGFKADTKVDTVFQVEKNNGCLYYYTAVAGGKSAVVP